MCPYGWYTVHHCAKGDEAATSLTDYLLTGLAGTIKLPNVPRPRLKVCVLGDAVHCEQAQRANIPFKSVEDLKKLNKNKKMVKKLADSFDAFLASQDRILASMGPNHPRTWSEQGFIGQDQEQCVALNCLDPSDPTFVGTWPQQGGAARAGKFPTLVQHADNLETKAMGSHSWAPVAKKSGGVGHDRWT
eukprot:Skav209615  [mRNA]  locus=scaffold1634:560278:566740:- [translate_table: standard]